MQRVYEVIQWKMTMLHIQSASKDFMKASNGFFVMLLNNLPLPSHTNCSTLRHREGKYF